jgi:hypothetical protein
MFPRVFCILLRCRLIGDFVIFIVHLHEVLDDCTALPQHGVSVGVFESRHTAIGVQAEEWLLLDLCHADLFYLIGNAEFEDNDQDFQRVGTLWRVSGLSN